MINKEEDSYLHEMKCVERTCRRRMQGERR